MSDEEEIEFKINEDYANRYNKWREKEELQKCMYFVLLFQDTWKQIMLCMVLEIHKC